MTSIPVLFHFDPNYMDRIANIEYELGNTIKDTTLKVKNFVCKYWSYFSKPLLVSKFILKGFKAGVVSTASKIGPVLTHLRWFAVIGIATALDDLNNNIQSIWKGLKVHDFEGVAFSSLGVTVIACDIIDGIGTILGGVVELTSKAAINVFSYIATPVVLYMGFMGFGLNIVKSSRVASLYFDTNALIEKLSDSNATEQDKWTHVSSTLNKYVSDELEGERKRKWRVLDRISDSSVREKWVEAANKVEEGIRTQELLNSIQEVMQATRKYAKHKTALHLTSAGGSAVMASGLIAFSVTPLVAACPFAPFVVLGLGATTKLSQFLYQRWGVNPIAEEVAATAVAA